MRLNKPNNSNPSAYPKTSKSPLIRLEIYSSFRTSFAKSHDKKTLYLTLLIFNKQGEFLTTNKNLFPSIEIIRHDAEYERDFFEDFKASSEEFVWVQQVVQDWEPTTLDCTDPTNTFALRFPAVMERYQNTRAESIWMTRFRKSYYAAVLTFLHLLKIRDFGFMHPAPMSVTGSGTHFLVHIISSDALDLDSDTLKNLKLSWQAPKKINSGSYQGDSFLDLMDFPNIIYNRHLHILKAGLYMAFFDANASLQGIGEFIEMTESI